MKKFATFLSQAIIIPEENIDTDQIYPARFLKGTGYTDYGNFLFYDWRFDNEGKQLISVFNEKLTKNKKILITSANFGIGSSREQAVWALVDFGFKAVISASFGDIFYQNALKNGLLAVKLPVEQITALYQVIKSNPQTVLTINLIKQWIITQDKKVYEFVIDPFRKNCLLHGTDEIGYLLEKETLIKQFELTKNI